MQRAASWADPRSWGSWPESSGQWWDMPGSSTGRVFALGEGRPIVVVGGLAGGCGLLSPLLVELAERHSVYAIDLDGQPRLRRGERITIGSEAQRVADAIGWLGLERPTLLGVSYGGAVALELAARRPGLLGGLILSGIEAAFRPNLGTQVARRVLEKYALPPDSPFVNQFFNLLHGERPGSAQVAEFVVDRCWETDQSLMVRRLQALDGFDVADRLWKVQVPTRVVAGSRDLVVPPARQRALAQGIVGARFAIVEGAGHVGFATHPAEFARQARAFVAQRARAYC